MINMDVIANAGLDDEEEEEEEGVWCADGLVNLKIVSVTSGNEDSLEVSSDDNFIHMIPNRDKDSIKKEIKTELENVHHVDEIIIDDDDSNLELNIDDIVINVGDIIKKEPNEDIQLHPSYYSSIYVSGPSVPSYPVTSSSNSSKNFRHAVGELVCAKMTGYPAWPAIIVRDPKTEQFVKTRKVKGKEGARRHKEKKPKEERVFHVLFLNYKEQVAWLSESSLSKYQPQLFSKKSKASNDTKFKASKIANSLLSLSCEERIYRYVEIQKMNKKDDKKKLYSKKYPKLFHKPIVKLQRIERVMMKSLKSKGKS